jgi:CRP-like cAMP-binding protein
MYVRHRTRPVVYFSACEPRGISLQLIDKNNSENRFLKQLPAAQRARMLASCEAVDLVFSAVLTLPGDALTHVYFPLGSFISQIAQVDRRGIEVALVGDEGMYGVHVGMGLEESPVKAIVQGAGPALQMPVAAFRKHLAASPELRKQFARYTWIVYSQVIQSAGCNRFHVVEQRLARWLLMTADRAHSQSFDITQAFMAMMLGVRRVGVTKAASELQARGLIRYVRGYLHILDLKGLRQAACSCYRSDLMRYETVFGESPALGGGGEARVHVRKDS